MSDKGRVPRVSSARSGRRVRPAVEVCEARALLAAGAEGFGSWRPGGAEVAPITPLDFPGAWIVVFSTADDGPGSLRQAIRQANTRPGFDTLAFDLSPDPSRGTPTIRPLSALPALTEPALMDGRTQPTGVVLDGRLAGPGVDGLTITGGGSTVAGLTIVGFGGSGIVITGPGGNAVLGCRIGTDAAGAPDLGNGQDGLSVRGSAGNTLGGTEPGQGNGIAGNGLVGVRLAGAEASGNVVVGNAIGVDPSGTRAIPNRAGGLFLDGAPGNRVGGGATNQGNLIAGNAGAGVVIAGAGASGNRLIGNRIGTTVDGLAILGNAADGILLEGAPGNTIGGLGAGLGNLVSGNRGTGVRLRGAGASSIVIAGNTIGPDLSGTRALGNAHDGVFLDGAPRNVLTGNHVAGNGGSGIQLFGPLASGNRLQGNLVGLARDGQSALGNARDGLFVNGAPANLIGGTGRGEGNVVSANAGAGIDLLDRDATGNVVAGNFVGTDASGRVVAGLGNSYGLVVNGAPGNTLGGAAENIVAGNRLGDLVTLNLEPPLPRPTQVLSAQVNTSGSTATGITLSVSGGLDPASATRLSSYEVRLARDRRGPGPGAVVALRRAEYDPSRGVVTLTFARPVIATTAMTLTVNGLVDPFGRALDGDRDGRAGGAYVANLSGRPSPPPPVPRPRPTPPPRPGPVRDSGNPPRR